MTAYEKSLVEKLFMKRTALKKGPTKEEEEPLFPVNNK